MAWIQKLYETYENCRSEIGKVPANEDKVPLLPICHTTQKAHIEIVIDAKGRFKRAQVIPKAQSRTIIPATEDSAGRTSGPVAHPLCDKLQYVAKDYTKHGGVKDSRFELFIEQLKDWCNSNFSDPKLEAILKYVRLGTVVRDLINRKILLSGKNGKLLEKAEGKKEKDGLTIFDVVKPQPQSEAFIRWVVEIPGQKESRVWCDQTLWKKWIKYYSSTKKIKLLCFATGEEELMADQHPAKLRNNADKAKIISSNDLSNFTFRGRFLKADQAAGVSFQVTQKAHYALRWLISRQGYQKGDQAIIAWATSGMDIPQPLADPPAILGFDELPSDQALPAYTAENIGIKFRNRIAGYGSEIGNTTGVVVIALDSATPGRMSITFYRELTGSEYLERINHWHETCSWLHRYRTVETQMNGKTKRIPLPFVGAPAPNDIAEAAYGGRVDDKLKKATVERLLPCIIDGQPLPRDIVESTARRASNRVALENWQFEKTLSIACALFKKFKNKENYTMALDPNRKTRDYLYGRLLALADSLEGWALNKANEDRQTTAARLMNRFAERPYSTWRTIELALSPYKARLGGKSKKRQKMIDEVKDLFEPNDFINDKRLSGEFLLGYSSQRELLRNSSEKQKESGEENESNSNNN